MEYINTYLNEPNKTEDIINLKTEHYTTFKQGLLCGASNSDVILKGSIIASFLNTVAA